MIRFSILVKVAICELEKDETVKKGSNISHLFRIKEKEKFFKGKVISNHKRKKDWWNVKFTDNQIKSCYLSKSLYKKSWKFS